MENKNANLGKEIKKQEEKIQPAAEPTVASATPEKKKSKWWVWLLGCCGGLIIIMTILLFVGYFTIGKKVIEEVKEASESGDEQSFQDFQEDFFEEFEEAASEEADSSEKSVVGEESSEVVENYLNSVLGTLPNSVLDDEVAKSYLTDELKSQYDDDYFIQQTLCIQDGPSDIRVINKDSYGKEAYITVQAEYGDTYEDIWDFALRMEDDEWVIYAIYCLKN